MEQVLVDFKGFADGLENSVRPLCGVDHGKLCAVMQCRRYNKKFVAAQSRDEILFTQDTDEPPAR